MPQRFSAPFLLFLLLLGRVLNAQEPAKPELTPAESFQLGLGADASFIDAVVFQNAWKQACPSERCIVLRLDAGENPQAPITDAAAVYTKGREVFARSSAYGIVPLSTIAPTALEDTAKLRHAVLQQREGHSQLPEPTEAPLQQILIATARIRNIAAGKEFPIAMSKLKVQVRRGQERAQEEREYLIFDYQNTHYAYRPGAGVQGLPFPRNKTFDYAQPCVRGGDLIDAILYLQALRKREPGIKARICGIGTEASRPTRGLASVLIQGDKELRVHHLYLGDFTLENVPASAFENEALVCQSLINYYGAVYRRIQRARGQPQPQALRLSYDDLMSFYAITGPLEMPGDTDQMQTLRAAAALRTAGVDELKVSTSKALTFAFEGKRFAYSPSSGAGLLPPPKPPNVAAADVSTPPNKKHTASIATRYVPSKEEIAALTIKADAKDLVASKELGFYLLEGNGVPKDRPKAELYLGKAADGGDGECAITLARFFDKPKSPETDLVKARAYYLTAAKASYPVAMYNYGGMLFSGRGGKRDLTEGLAWLILAGRLGFDGPGERDARRDLVKFDKVIRDAELRADELHLNYSDPSAIKQFTPNSEPAPSVNVDLSR